MLFFYSSMFTEVTEPAQIILRDKALKKDGLKFVDKLMQIDDQPFWKSVSMMNRIQRKMLSTTNSLESFHGQINKQTPRRNYFWKAFYKLVLHFYRKAQNIQEAMNHNFLYEKRTTLQQGFHYCKERMKQQISEYKTTITRCLCGGNKFLSAIMNIDFQCAHRIYTGAEFPEGLIASITNKYQWTTIMKLDVETSDKIYAVEMIRHFSMCKSSCELFEKKFF